LIVFHAKSRKLSAVSTRVEATLEPDLGNIFSAER
jgi:hypothetical protein